MVVSSGAQPNTKDVYAGSVTSVSSTGGVNTTAYANQHQGETQVTRPIVKQRPINGFRKPTGYRRFDSRVRPEQFDYYTDDIRNPPPPPILPYTNYARSGLTPVNPSYGIGSIAPYHGTKAQGTVRVPDVSENLKARGRTEALLKLQDGSFNVAVAIAEARQTFDLIAVSSIRLASAYRAFRRGDFRSINRTLGLTGRQGLADNWLSYQYGWLPLLSDMYGATRALTGKMSAPNFVSVYRRVTSDYGPYIPSLTNKVNYRYDGKCTVGFETRLNAKLDNPTLAIVSALGLTNPLLVAWEKLPFSFVVDWLVPIGNTLRGLSSTLGLVFDSGYETQFSEQSATVTWFHVPTGYVLTKAVTPCSLNLRNQCMLRDPVVAFPSSGFYVKSPFSTTRALNALALVSSAFGHR